MASPSDGRAQMSSTPASDFHSIDFDFDVRID
jgi:hypothetical protein